MKSHVFRGSVCCSSVKLLLFGLCVNFSSNLCLTCCSTILVMVSAVCYSSCQNGHCYNISHCMLNVRNEENCTLTRSKMFNSWNNDSNWYTVLYILSLQHTMTMWRIVVVTFFRYLSDYCSDTVLSV